MARVRLPPEDELAELLTEAKIPFKRQVKAIPSRDFAFDFQCFDPYWEPKMPDGSPTPYRATYVLVEVQGGIWMGRKGKGAHSTGTAITRDCEKACLAAVHGNRLLPVTAAQVRSGMAVTWIRDALRTIVF